MPPVKHTLDGCRRIRRAVLGPVAGRGEITIDLGLSNPVSFSPPSACGSTPTAGSYARQRRVPSKTPWRPVGPTG